MLEKVTLEIVTLRKPLSTDGVESGFRRVTIVMLPSLAYNIYYIILYWMLISLSTLCLLSSWSRWHYYLSLAFRNRFIQTLKWHQSESMVNSTCINLEQSIIFWNITHCQAVSTISKFYHVFITQRVILIFINYISQPIRICTTMLHESIILWIIHVIPRCDMLPSLVNSGFLRMTISNVILSYMQYLYIGTCMRRYLIFVFTI